MTIFLDVAAIDEQRKELVAEMAAIFETAKAEPRDLLDDEVARIDEIQGTDGKGGLLAKLDADYTRKSAIEANMARKFGQKIENGDVPTPGATPDPNNRDSLFQNISVPAVARNHGKLKAFRDDRDGEKEAYVSGRWLASLMGHSASSKWLTDNGFQNAMSTSDNDSAGLFVPGELSQTIIRLVEEYGEARQQFGIQPVAGERWAGPVRVSGMTAYPVAETTTANEGSNTGTKSQPTYKQIELVMRKWKAWTKMSDELNDRSFINIAEQVATESATAFAYAEDNSAWNGTGTAAFHGNKGIFSSVLAGSTSMFGGAASGILAFSDLTVAHFETLIGMLPDYSGIDPVWNISKQGYYASMHRLLMAAGGNDASNLEAGGRPMFLGYPVRFNKVLPTTTADQASVKAITFGDAKMGARLGSNGRVRMSVSTERFWDEDQIGIKAEEFFDINVFSTGSASAAGAILVGQFSDS